jgi:crotonobetainyl-CoA:carnitine CoA-transferase CaiB-like acyl-CoA transferase
MNSPLRGIRVVDFGQGVAGPYCGRLLAEYGADVIKIEPPRGDWSRQMGVQSQSGASGTFVAVNWNKRGVCLDLNRSQHLGVARDLVRTADVVVESFRPGVMRRFALNWESAKVVNPALIYCQISGFGQSGPNVALPGGDSIMQAYGGLMSIVGEEDGPPMRVGNVVSDMLAGANAFSGVLMALLGRQHTGLGQRVTTSLLRSMIAFQAPMITEYLMTGVLPGRHGNQHPLISPSGAFETADGYVTMTVLAHQWPRFCRQMGLDRLAEHALFATSNLRQENRHELRSLLAPIFLKHTTQVWVDRLRADDILCAPIHDYALLTQDAQVVHECLIQQNIQSGLPNVGSPVDMEPSLPRENVLQQRHPPQLGEHTAEVLKDVLGWEDRDVQHFLNDLSGSQVSTS